jgi:hypothetical protein
MENTLEIKGIKKLVGMKISDREIVSVTVHSYTNRQREAYRFNFKPLPKTPQSKMNHRLKVWEDKFAIHLDRVKEDNGKYRLFVMGLCDATNIGLDIEDIQNLQRFCECMGKVIHNKYKWCTK